MPIITEKLNYIYNPKSPFRTAAVKDISLHIKDGGFYGIIGETGSGKSTLIQHFNALLKPYSGAIFVNGANLSDKKTDLKEIRSKVGMVFQYPEYQLFAETVYMDVAFGIKNFFCRLSRKDKKAGKTALPESEVERLVKEAVTLVGLDYEKIKDKSPFDLSGGQKRRVAIAGVIATKPEVLVLDEPTAGLDPCGKEEILSLIRNLKAECSPTVIMISHDMDEIAKNCQEIIVLKGGELKGVMSPAALFSDNAFIAENGIDLPQSVKLREKLRTAGIDYNINMFTAEEAAEAIYKSIAGAGKGGGNA